MNLSTAKNQSLTVSLEDDRPTISPYIEPALTFEIGSNRVSYSVPRIYTSQSTKWTSPSAPFNRFDRFNTQTIELPNVDEDIGHTLVHYLYTGNYQTLKLQGVSELSNSTTEYRRACLVYDTARLYGLDRLAEHAIKTMELFEKALSLFQILDIIREIYPKLISDKNWFSEYLKTKINAAFEANKIMFSQEQFLNHIGEAASFNRTLVEIMVGILTGKITNTAQKEVTEESALEDPLDEFGFPLLFPNNPAKDNPPPLPEHPTIELSVWTEPSLMNSDSNDSWHNVSVKGQTATYEEEAEPIPQADEFDWPLIKKKGKRRNKVKKIVVTEDLELASEPAEIIEPIESSNNVPHPPLPAPLEDEEEWSSLAATKKTKKGKKVKKSGTATCSVVEG